MKKLSFVFLSVLVSACAVLPTQHQKSEINAKNTLPLMSNIAKGTLENGLQYIVIPNDKPAEQVSLQLIVKAGSLHEQQDQKGIAHLVEHMAFNGTEQYPSNRIIERQEELGMVFGRDVNATTSFHTTSYFLHLPNNHLEVIDEAFNMLHQQMTALTFDQHELENERPVVEEEWRRSLSMRNRLSKANNNIIKAGSRYIERLPIGDMALVRHVDASRIKAFWQDWYHPNNMVFVAVGATNEKQIKALLNKYFSAMPSVKLPSLPNTVIPLTDTLSFNTITDKELNTESVTVNFRAEAPTITTVESFKNKLISDLSMYLLSDRLRNQYQAGGENIYRMSMSSYGLAPGYNNTRIFALLNNDNYHKAIQEVFNEISRYAHHGFTEADLKPVKRVLNEGYKNTIENSQSVKNKSLIKRVFNKIRHDKPLTSVPNVAKLAQELMQKITIQEVNQHLRVLIKNRVPTVVAQVKPENVSKQPSVSEINGMWLQALSTPPPATQGIRVDTELFDKTLPKVKVVKHKKLGNIHVWTLANNAEIWFQPSDKSPDSLLVRWQGNGGTQHLQKSQQRTAQLAVKNMSGFGYANFNALQLERLNAGKSFRLGASVNQLQHQISGSTTKSALEAWLQNFYLLHTQAQVNADIWQSKKQLMLKGLKGADKSPERKFSKKLMAALYPENSILQPLKEEELSVISSDDLLPAWKSIFNSSTKHKLLIIGNAEPEWVIEQVAKYIGNLPTGTEKVKLTLPKLAQSKQNITVYAGTEPKATTEMFWVVDQPYNQTKKREAGIISKVINLRMRKQLREIAGGVYSSSFSVSLDRTRDQLFATLSYSHQPERAEELQQMALQVIENIVANGITESEISTIREQIQQSLKPENLRDSQKLGWMSRFAKNDEFYPMPDHYLTWLSNVTPEQLADIPQQLLSFSPQIHATKLPEQ